MLGSDNKIAKPEFPLLHLKNNSNQIQSKCNVVLIKEKWFYLSKINIKYCPVPEEEDL